MWLVSVLVIGCGGGGSGDGSASPTADSATPTPVATPAENARDLSPPLEGQPLAPFGRERINYREHLDYQLPQPSSLPPIPDGLDGPEYEPVSEPSCPKDWTPFERLIELIRICFPAGWDIDGHGYVHSGEDDEWYSVGFFKFRADDSQSAHVSVSIMGAFSRPQTYTHGCNELYQTTLGGLSAAICANASGVYPEARIVHYYVPIGPKAVFVNVVSYYDRDPESGRYLDTWSEEDLETAIQIAHTITFLEGPALFP